MMRALEEEREKEKEREAEIQRDTEIGIGEGTEKETERERELGARFILQREREKEKKILLPKGGEIERNSLFLFGQFVSLIFFRIRERDKNKFCLVIFSKEK